MSAWTKQIFNSQIARRGGIVRRKLSSIDKYSSRASVKNEVVSRGYHIVEHSDQWLIFCDHAQIRVVV